MKQRNNPFRILLGLFIFTVLLSCSSKETPDSPTPEKVFYTITFDTDGGTVIDNKTVLGGETLTKPTDPTKENYTFVDWYTDKERTTAFDFESPITSDMTLYVRWLQEGEILDDNFRAYLKEKLPDAFEGDLLKVKHESVTTLTEIIVGSKNISSLEGVQYFTALTKLWCFDNQLTTLDVSQNTALTRLLCYNNQLTTLDVGQNVALKELSCNNNRLTTLDVSQNKALEILYCHNNQLTTLDVGQNTALTGLWCYNNQLTTLDVSQNKALEILFCYNNQLTTLDVSQNVALKELSCNNNQLTTLDMSQSTALTKLWCHNNQLTTLDVSHSTALTFLHCAKNQLTTLDMSHSTALTYLYCPYNKLTTLDVSQSTALTYLRCTENPKLSEILVHEDKVCDAGVTSGGGIKEIFNTNKGKGLDMHIKTYDDAGTETNDYDEAGYAVACP